MAAAGTKRLKDVLVEKPIITGSVAFWMGKVDRQPGEHSHRWHVYVRSPTNEDLTYFVKKVVFGLHESYAKPHRTVEEPPYEITETGWGEFDVEIKIYFVDPLEKPVVLYHTLKLYHLDGSPLTVDRPVVNEQYDELLFQDPTEQFYRRLITGTAKRVESHLSPYYPQHDEAAALATVRAARERGDQVLRELRQRVAQLDGELTAARRDLQILQQYQGQMLPSAYAAGGAADVVDRMSDSHSTVGRCVCDQAAASVPAETPTLPPTPAM